MAWIRPELVPGVKIDEMTSDNIPCEVVELDIGVKVFRVEG